MAEDLSSGISSLEQLIRLLSEARDTLDATSASWKNLNDLIQKLAEKSATLASIGTTLGGFKLVSPQAIEDVDKFVASVNRAIKAIEEGSSKIQAFPGIKGGFNPLAVQQARGAEATRAEAGFTGLEPEKVVTQVQTIETAIADLRKQLETLNIAPASIDKIIEKVRQMGIAFIDVSKNARFGETSAKGVENLLFTLETAEGQTKKFKLAIDEATRSLAQMQQEAQKPPVARFAETLQAAGVPRPARKQIVEETFGGGLGLKVTDTSTVQIKKLEDGIIQLTTTLKVGERGAASYTRVVNQMGQVLSSLPQKIEAAGAAGFQQVFGATPEVGERVTKIIQKYGFELNQLNRITTEASTGIRTMNFAVKDGEGVYRNLTMHVDRFGNVLHDSSRRFRDFGSAIVRNISESFRWAIAITAVYLPLRKLQEGIGIAIDNEAKLAGIGVVLGRSHKELSDAFDAAAGAAKATGESINGVLEGYTQAFRATGNIGDETERATVAQKLLIDSLVLSKLSSLDQATAMDTLVGALRQAGLALDEGQQLLDSWVAVTRRANVDLTTLAESFAITSTSAENAGVSFDELNGIIATVAETTTLSATEAGNAVRAFISGFQTQKARDELSKFGISIEDIDGNVKDFLAVMREISELRTLGLIDSAQLNRIGEALGGGARRGAQYVAFIENLNRVQQVASISANAQGEAMDALEITMETVQTAVTQLGNSFQELAQAVGQEGGVLTGLKALLNLLTEITDAATTLSKLLGPTAPLVVGGGALAAYLGTRGRLPGIQQSISERVTQQARNILPTATANQYGVMIGGSFQRSLAAKLPLIGTLMGEAFIAALNIQQKDWDGLGGQVAGGIIGGIVGGPLGIIIGSTAGEAFMNFISQRKGDFESLITPLAPGAQIPGAEPVEKTPAELLAQRQQELIDKILFEAGGAATANIQKLGLQFEEVLRKAFGKDAKIDTTKLDTVSTALEILRRKLEALERANPIQALGLDIEAEKGKIRELIKEIEELKNAQDLITEGKLSPEIEAGPFGKEVLQVTKQYGDLLNTEIKQAHKDLFEQLSKGNITSKEYTQSLQNLSSGGLAVAQIFTAANDVLGNTEEAFLKVTEVVTTSTQDQIDQLNLLTGQIAKYETDLEDLDKITIVNNENLDELEKLKVATKDTSGELLSFSQIAKNLEDRKIFIQTNLLEIQDQLSGTINGLFELQRAAQLELPKVTQLGIAPEDFDLVLQRAQEIDTTFIEEAIKKGFLPSDATAEEVKDSWGDIFVQIAEDIFKRIGGVLPESLQQAIKELESEGQITPRPQAGPAFGIKTIDMTQQAFLAAYNKQLAFLQQAFGDQGWKPDLQTMGLIFKDGTDVLHLDNLVMQLAMQELIDVNRKQLEGVFNLPADSSFFVPFQGYKLGFDQGTGMGAAATGLQDAGNKLLDAANALKEAARERLLEREARFESQDDRLRQESLRQPTVENRERLLERESRFARQDDRSFDRETLRRLQESFKPQLEERKPVQTLADPAFSELILKLAIAIDNLALKFQPVIGERDKVLGIQVPERKTGEQTFFDRLLQLMPALLAPQPLGTPTGGVGGGVNVLDNLNSILSILQQKVQTLSGFSTNLKIESRSTTTLVVDGRTLAQVIKPYLYSDLIRFEDTSNNITRTIVV